VENSGRCADGRKPRRAREARARDAKQQHNEGELIHVNAGQEWLFLPLGLLGHPYPAADRLSLTDQFIRKTLVLIGEAQELAPPCWIRLTFRRFPHLCSKRTITLRPRQVILHFPISD
jgi:hypothetical protein